MASMNVPVTYKGRQSTVAVLPDNTVEHLTETLQQQLGLHKHRQGIKYTASVVAEGANGKQQSTKIVRLTGRAKKLSDYGVTEKTELEVKDLGPQFSYRGVFVVEYLGPILIMLAYAARPSFLYGKGADQALWSWVAKAAVVAWLLHFLKREFETFFVHRFSRPTMPRFNLFKNSVYYWGFALMVGYPLCSPLYTPPANDVQVYVGLGIMLVSELLNFAVHMQLRNMRPGEGSDVRQPPVGGLFNLASCPNYTFEVLGWVGFSIATNILFAYLFTLAGFFQMVDWALKKHRAYVKQDPKLKKRKAIVPFVL